MKLGIKYVPESHSNLCEWYTTDISVPGWYYFSLASGFNSIDPTIALKTIDEPLKRLHDHLWNSEYLTIPSCAGHNYGSDHYCKLFDRVVKDCFCAKTSGITVYNTMNGRADMWYDPDIQFPWSNRDVFVRESSTNSYHGRCGFEVNSRDEAVLHSLCHELKIGAVRDFGSKRYVVFDTTIRDEKNRLLFWELLTDCLISRLGL